MENNSKISTLLDCTGGLQKKFKNLVNGREIKAEINLVDGGALAFVAENNQPAVKLSREQVVELAVWIHEFYVPKVKRTRKPKDETKEPTKPAAVVGQA